MYEGGCYEDTGPEVPAEEEDVVWNRETWVALDEDGKGACCS